MVEHLSVYLTTWSLVLQNRKHKALETPSTMSFPQHP